MLNIAERAKNVPWYWYAVAFVIIVLDQLTKWMASSNLEYSEVIPIFYGFNITLRHNTGAAFSFLHDAGGWQVYFLGGLAAAVSVGLVYWIARLGKQFSFETLGLALILGGAIGNLYDRVLLGYVVDFIEFYYESYYFPAFNIADSAITCGAGLLIYDAIFIKKKTASEQS